MSTRPHPPLPPVPAALTELAGTDPRLTGWVESLPGRVLGTLQRWDLRLDLAPGQDVEDVLPGAGRARHSWILPVRDGADDGDGTPLVLKLASPDQDGAGEIPTLKAWNARAGSAGTSTGTGTGTGSGTGSCNGTPAVRLHRATPATGTLLLDRLGPGSLAELPALEACEVAGGVLAALRTPAPPTVPPLATALTGWLDDLETLGKEVPAPPRYTEQALRLGRTLVESLGAEEYWVVHGDLHYDNVLRSAGNRPGPHPWLVIDPKGYAGDPAFDVAPLLWNRWEEATRYGKPQAAVLARFYAVVDAAGLDEARPRDWVVVRAMVGASWEVLAAREGVLSPAARDLVTRYVTVTKAMQEVRAWTW